MKHISVELFEFAKLLIKELALRLNFCILGDDQNPASTLSSGTSSSATERLL